MACLILAKASWHTLNVHACSWGFSVSFLPPLFNSVGKPVESHGAPWTAYSIPAGRAKSLYGHNWRWNANSENETCERSVLGSRTWRDQGVSHRIAYQESKAWMALGLLESWSHGHHNELLFRYDLTRCIIQNQCWVQSCKSRSFPAIRSFPSRRGVVGSSRYSTWWSGKHRSGNHSKILPEQASATAVSKRRPAQRHVQQ